jgi:hypothetical protein
MSLDDIQVLQRMQRQLLISEGDRHLWRLGTLVCIARRLAQVKTSILLHFVYLPLANQLDDDITKLGRSV